MRTSFYERIDEISLAVMDLCDYYGDGLIITRINVPRKHRGLGYGRNLLRQCLREADETRTVLFLEIGSPYVGDVGLSRDQLREWYERHGFRDIGGMYRRLPRASEDNRPVAEEGRSAHTASLG